MLTLLFNYYLDNINQPRKNVINDLGVIFDSKISFEYYVDTIKNKSYIKLGLIKQMCTDFNNESALTVLYCFYASLVWNSVSISQYQCLSSVQIFFLSYLSYKCGSKTSAYQSYPV